MSRISLKRHAPAFYRAMCTLDETPEVDPALAELVRIRASQINGCAYCVDMHCTDARTAGEDERRIWAVSAWREAPFFDARERAAFALTEAMTQLPAAGVPDAAYDEAARVFDPAELANLMALIIVINAWNRIGVGTRLEIPVSVA